MSDPLVFLWPCVDTPEPRFTASQIASWPADAVRQLQDLRILRRTDNTMHVVCPGCSEGHVEEVVPRTEPDGHTRFFVACPESLRAEVPEMLLFQWTIDFDALAQAIAGGMTLKGRCTTVLPNRLWRLGKTPWQGANREVLLARGLLWPDGMEIMQKIGASGRPIVLASDQVPPVNTWPGRVPAVVPLSRVVSQGPGGAEVDITHMLLLVRDADADAEAAQALPLDRRQKNLLVRRQLKVEIKSFLKDEELVAAYAQHQSYRKAAEALSNERNMPVSKDQVYRAVQRFGGPKAIAQVDDSASVTRAVASHHRDRTRKTFLCTEPSDSKPLTPRSARQ